MSEGYNPKSRHEEGGVEVAVASGSFLPTKGLLPALHTGAVGEMLHTLQRCLWTPGRATGLGLERQGSLPPAGNGVPNPDTHSEPGICRIITGHPQAGVHGSVVPAAQQHLWKAWATCCCNTSWSYLLCQWGWPQFISGDLHLQQPPSSCKTIKSHKKLSL